MASEATNAISRHKDSTPKRQTRRSPTKTRLASLWLDPVLLALMKATLIEREPPPVADFVPTKTSQSHNGMFFSRGQNGIGLHFGSLKISKPKEQRGADPQT